MCIEWGNGTLHHIYSYPYVHLYRLLTPSLETLSLFVARIYAQCTHVTPNKGVKLESGEVIERKHHFSPVSPQHSILEIQANTNSHRTRLSTWNISSQLMEKYSVHVRFFSFALELETNVDKVHTNTRIG